MQLKRSQILKPLNTKRGFLALQDLARGNTAERCAVWIPVVFLADVHWVPGVVIFWI